MIKSQQRQIWFSSNSCVPRHLAKQTYKWTDVEPKRPVWSSCPFNSRSVYLTDDHLSLIALTVGLSLHPLCQYRYERRNFQTTEWQKWQKIQKNKRKLKTLISLLVWRFQTNSKEILTRIIKIWWTFVTNGQTDNRIDRQPDWQTAGPTDRPAERTTDGHLKFRDHATKNRRKCHLSISLFSRKIRNCTPHFVFPSVRPFVGWSVGWFLLFGAFELSSSLLLPKYPGNLFNLRPCPPARD